jgi:hypothetical protein
MWVWGRNQISKIKHQTSNIKNQKSKIKNQDSFAALHAAWARVAPTLQNGMLQSGMNAAEP